MEARGCVVIFGASGELGRVALNSDSIPEGVQRFGTFNKNYLQKSVYPMTSVDICDRDAVFKFVESLPSPVRALQCAVSPQSCGSHDLRTATVQGSVNVVDAVLSVGGDVVVMSTDLVFDGKRGNYSEQDSLSPTMEYGHAKAEMERAVLSAGDGKDGRVIVVRTSLILTNNPPGKHIQWLNEVVDKTRDAVLFTDELRNAVWSSDLTNAMLELVLHSNFRGVIHIGGPNATTRYEIAKLIARVRGVNGEHIKGALSAESGLNRPLDCSMNLQLAHTVLKQTKLHSVEEGLRGKCKC